MSALAWETNGDELLLKSSSGIIAPSAMDVFQAEFSNKKQYENFLIDKKPSEQFPDVKFSRFPAELFVAIENDKQAGNRLQVSVCCKIKSENILLDVLGRKTDHLIFDNTWFPFAEGLFGAIRELLAALEIVPESPVTLKQYFNLVLQCRRDGIPFVDHGDLAAGHVAGGLPSEQTEIIRFLGKMYPYQEQGVRWLDLIAAEGLGCILGDEMGLGKTIQIIALIAAESTRRNAPCMVIAPATLMENWRREIARFAPAVHCMIHQGPSRTGNREVLAGFNVVISSYDTVVRDILLLEKIHWNLLVLDEAQAIRNPETQRAVAVKQLPRRVSIAVTGTPVENRLLDLWSITDFVLPNLLGDINDFLRIFSDTIHDARLLEPFVTPLLLRRRVAEVADDLPARIEIPQPIVMDGPMAELYEETRLEIISECAGNASFALLLKLRMLCTHPRLLGDRTSDLAAGMPKYQRLLEILEEIFSHEEKALIFTGFTKMTDLFLADLPRRFPGIIADFIDGRVPVSGRQEKVDRFSAFPGPGVLVLNPRAAGVGLNIVAANHVIHYNPEWNPAVQDQASARSYRRGQTKPVTIHHLFFISSVEEFMLERLDLKRTLASAAVVGTDGDSEPAGVLEALKISPLSEVRHVTRDHKPDFQNPER